jgi:RNA polymerase sigma factor (sigma-70 family)
MLDNDVTISERIDHLFRHEYGKLVSILTKTFGSSNIELAEDVVQEAMLEALNKWTYNGVPDNPVGWIYKVAKFKAINTLKREKYKNQYSLEITNSSQDDTLTELDLNDVFSEKEIADDQLRMIFTCSHPSLSVDSQIALTLKTLCGFSIPEIAKAFLTSEENINKRLVRARKTIRHANVPFEVPKGKELVQRLASVHETIYLVFNEGYNSTSNDKIIRMELCQEAIRLAEMIANKSEIQSANTYALLALMTLNASRLDSREGDLGEIIDLEHQDRSTWDQEQITKGLYYLDFATQQNEVSKYHILATISGQHCTAPNYDRTDWDSILMLYDKLIEIDNSPVVLLNRAIVLSKTSSVKLALKELESLKDNHVFQNYLPYYTTRAALLFKNSNPDQAIKLLNKALDLNVDDRHKSIINSMIAEYEKNI